MLTGSQHFGLTERVTQSLAGRSAILEVLPFNTSELKRGQWLPSEINQLLWKGFYPPVYDRDLRPNRWYIDYIATYIHRDVRQISQIQNLDTFTRFLRLCAGQVGQLLNTVRLGIEIGMDHKTVRKWITVLKASFIINLLEPFRQNFRKRIIKTPKLYFYDTGLVCSLLGIQTPEQLEMHPLRGAIFENWIYSEIAKGLANNGKPQFFYFWRTHGGQEVDFIVEQGQQVFAIEAKAGNTIKSEMLQSLLNFMSLWKKQKISGWVVYSGDESRIMHGCQILPWNQIDKFINEELTTV